MKRYIFNLIIVFLLLFTINISATIWIVDNNPIPAGDFTDLLSAHNAAASGDTIYVYPSNTTYSAITINKSLIIFGTGFDLDIHGGLAFPASSSINGTMVFASGSEGSSLIGFDGDFVIDINTDNITIKRNEINRITLDGSNSIISQNEMVGNVTPAVLLIGANLSNVLIANNKVYNTSNYWTDRDAIESNINSTITVVNNVLRADVGYALRNLSNTDLVQNNIIIFGDVSENAVYQYNMSNLDQLPLGIGNIENIDMTTVFDDPNDFDSGLHLLPASPATGAGFNGTDMGIYGGNAPYVDGGLPGLPAIYHLESEVITTPQSGLDVVIKAKTNRE